ncbi:four-carbon acid sugar kinase family protein [Cyanobium sp. FGCU-6]|nr:four-carbon acid sugar kinase family protein [Cyanobium sp. FGCU6]
MKIVVIDDDPTGSQTVHGCPLLLRWDPVTLDAALADPSPLLFLLANTRALGPDEARARIRELAAALVPALARARERGLVDGWILVSRGDSTLRGHFPLEVEELAAALGPFDATLLVPAFLEGGRTTVDGVHLLHGRPVHESAFARDGLFGYATSHLPDWVEERSGGRLSAAQVQRLGLAELEGDPARLRQRLAAFADQALVAVDAERPVHLQALAAALRDLSAPSGDGEASSRRPRRFLAQSAAGLPAALAALPPQPLDAAALAGLRRRDQGDRPLPGLVLVGSHVPLADAQLERLLTEPLCRGIELPVARLHRVLEGPLPERLLASLEADWLQQLQAVLAEGRTPVLFTSRGELRCRHAAERRALGLALAGLMARLGGSLAPDLGYMISKGGITTHTLLADGLGLERVDLQGQLLPGLSVVLVPVAGGPGLPVLTFPGNLGDADTLRQAWAWMEQGGPG